MAGRRTAARWPALATSLALAVAACGGGGDEAPAGGSTTTVETMFGEVSFPADPERVVALGWSDAETALALGVQPVGASDWLAFGGEGVGAWAEGMYDEPPTILGTTEVDYEAVAALEPDLILDTRSDGDPQRNELLTQIAPTVGPPEGVVSFGTTWRQQTEMVARALGRVDEGDELVADVEQDFADAATSHPEFAGQEVVVGAFFTGRYGAYVAGDSRADLMAGLGFELKPEVEALASGSFYVDVSSERLDLLDADLTVVLPLDGDPAPVLEDPLVQQLPSAQAGRLVVLDDMTLLNAFSSGSALGTSYALDEAVPLFADAVR